MLLYSGILALGLASGSTSAITRREANTTETDSLVSGAYIVKFAAGHESPDSFYQNLTVAGINAVPRRTFSTDLYPGTSFHADDADVDRIQSFDQVESITPVRLLSLITPVDWNSHKAALGQLKSKRHVNGRSVSDINGTISTHVMTGVDKLHEEGFDGTGIKIAIVDSGIDYTLPALGGGFGPGFKVAFGTDLVGDKYTGTNTPVPDDDPLDCFGHGTHVAGIVGASNDPYVLGVAPNATLGIYKVFGCQDSTVAEDVLISAFLMAHEEGVDVITASIGFSNGWPEEPWAAAVSAIVAAGTPCMLAAGNNGARGIFYASSASAGNDVTSVGAVENTNLPEVLDQATYSIAGDADTSFGYNTARGTFGNISRPIWANTYDMTTVDDGCNGFPGVNLTGKIALIRRGTCTFDVKAASALAAGTTYIIYYNNVDGTVDGLVENYNVDGAAMVNPQVGAAWINALAAGKEVIVSFETGKPKFIISPGTSQSLIGGYMDTYTTWGLTNENTIKPIISAPGGSILSTYLSSGGGYLVESGTSMATPFIAGVAGLFIQSKGRKTTPREINAALSTTGTPLAYNDGTQAYPYLASVAQQGGGLVNAYSMIHATAKFTRANLPLNDTLNFQKKAKVDIKNTGSSTVTYTFTHQPASNVYAFNAGQLTTVAKFPVTVDEKYSKAVITPSTLTLAPGEGKPVYLSIKPDPSLNSSLVPVYSGYLKVQSSVNEKYSVPYAGVATAMQNIPILVPGSSFWVSKYSPINVAYNGTTIPGYTPNKLMTHYGTLSWSTSFARIDVVSVNGTNPVLASGLQIVGSTIGFPQTYLSRSRSIAADFNGTLADGSVVETGVYKFVLRVAKALGNFEKGEYEMYSSRLFFMNTD